MFNKIDTFKKCGLLACSFGLAVAIPGVVVADGYQSAAATVGNRAPSLGGGHNSQTFQSLPVRCVNGVESNVSYQQTTSFDLIYDYAYESFKSDMKIDGEFNYSYTDAYTADLKYSWATKLKDTSTSVSLLFKTQTEGMYAQWDLQAINGSFLNESGQVALNSDETGQQFYVTCGNSFVDSLSLGGSLYVALIIDFTTEWMKEHFEATAKANFTTAYGIYDMKNVIDYTKEKYGESASLRLTALQIGGSTTQLGELLSLAGGTSSDCIKDSSTKAECFSIIDRLQEYVAGEFADSLEESPTILDYNYASYIYLPEIGYDYTPIPQNVIALRKSLSEALLEQLELKSEWESRLANLEKLGPMLQQRLSQSRDAAVSELVVVDSNVQNLRNAREVCFSPSTDLIIEQCPGIASYVLDNLVVAEFPEFPPAVYPFGTLNYGSGGPEKECTIPELSVLTGIAVRVKDGDVKGIRCYYRPVNEDGALGAQTYRQVGSGTEATVIVPEGHVMIGYGYRVKDDNTKTSVAYYRQWDSDTRSLVGDVMSVRGGSHSSGGIERQFTTEYNSIRGIPADVDHTILTGIGAASKGDNARMLRVHLGWIE